MCQPRHTHQTRILTRMAEMTHMPVSAHVTEMTRVPALHVWRKWHVCLLYMCVCLRMHPSTRVFTYTHVHLHTCPSTRVTGMMCVHPHTWQNGMCVHLHAWQKWRTCPFTHVTEMARVFADSIQGYILRKNRGYRNDRTKGWIVESTFINHYS